ncbi:class I SAM-dependent methyltransferase [Crocinitomicaceae bacterium]|nr:class I SAM-dependent methyltransferase [Crocinitomicaceae bacterium]MDB3907698.1 class I SAM-dependent methyltransferase [Crocinitomicaceae bacterium]
MDYKKINKESWNKQVPVHFESDFYNVPAFIAGNTSLNQPELDILGDVSGKSILHLQCHFGQDTISLSRMGAITTGVDLSDTAIEQAKKLNEQCGTDAKFVVSDIYDLPKNLEGQFDIVFTSYGTIGWLPDLDKWAGVVNHFLKDGGTFIFAEFHPAVWMFDDDHNSVAYNYFTSDPIVESYSGTYAQKDSDVELKHISWNHGLAEVMTSLMSQGLAIRHFKEHDFSPYNCFNGMQEDGPKEFRITKFGNKMPLMYTLVAEK